MMMQNSVITDNIAILKAFGVTDYENISRAEIVLQAGEIPTMVITRFIIDGGLYDLEEQFEIKRKDND